MKTSSKLRVRYFRLYPASGFAQVSLEFVYHFGWMEIDLPVAWPLQTSFETLNTRILERARWSIKEATDLLNGWGKENGPVIVYSDLSNTTNFSDLPQAHDEKRLVRTGVAADKRRSINVPPRPYDTILFIEEEESERRFLDAHLIFLRPVPRLDNREKGRSVVGIYSTSFCIGGADRERGIDQLAVSANLAHGAVGLNRLNADAVRWGRGKFEVMLGELEYIPV